MNERGNIDERIKRGFFTSSTDEMIICHFIGVSLAGPSVLYFARIVFPRCLTTARRHSAIFLPARGWPHRLIMLMRNVQTDWLKRRNGVRISHGTARLIICPWDTRSIIAAGIASYPFYAKWERANGWPFETGWPSALGRSLPDTPDTSRDHSPYPQSFLRASHIGWPSKSRWATRRPIWPALLLADDCEKECVYIILFAWFEIDSIFISLHYYTYDFFTVILIILLCLLLRYLYVLIIKIQMVT